MTLAELGGGLQEPVGCCVRSLKAISQKKIENLFTVKIEIFDVLYS